MCIYLFIICYYEKWIKGRLAVLRKLSDSYFVVKDEKPIFKSFYDKPTPREVLGWF